MRRKYNYNSGFTLIELMVATSIFVMVVLAAIGALMITSNAAKESRSLRYAMDNVNYAMDTMTRNLRLGTEFSCTSAASGAGGYKPSVGFTGDCNLESGIVFTKTQSPLGSHYNIAYQLAPTATGNIIEKCEGTDPCVALTSPNVNITDLKFTVRGSYSPGPGPTNDFLQPSVEILLKGTVTISNKVTEFELQSLASQRTFE